MYMLQGDFGIKCTEFVDPREFSFQNILQRINKLLQKINLKNNSVLSSMHMEKQVRTHLPSSNEYFQLRYLDYK